MSLPVDLHTFLLQIGGPALLMWIFSDFMEQNKQFQKLSSQNKSYWVLGIAIALSFVGYGLVAWESGAAITVTPQLIYTVALGGITNWLSGNFYHAKVDSTATAVG